MLFLILSVLCSVSVGVLLKWSGRRGIDAAQAITWNYLAASALAWWLLRPSLESLGTASTPWPALLTLAVVLPGIFVVMARALREAGIVRTDAAQRLSLLLSLAAAFALFGERFQLLKLAGVATGLVAMAGILHKPDTGAAQRGAWPWLLGVWIGYALVDILLKQVARAGTPSTSALLVSFALAFVLMLGWQLWRHARGRPRLGWRPLWTGLALGTLNFGNILFYIRAHQALPDSPATVFAGMNIGVVALGTLAGVTLFGERTSVRNRIGLALAVVAIGLIALGARG
ncbi:EamA/RhaT family transporter [Stenotrophomonas sp. YIM B06876]|uniref:EamA family transporter n=1 Tax=Stenotrophomonas sp. YIM B06876 TaxID=3060211 RepID=UPI002739EADC|nr:EamA/RhaT family transporter [Stenotrophomonas sp. YIM B06876]